MAEAFSNAVTRAAGIVTTSTACSIGIQTNKISGIATNLISVGYLVDNTNYLAGSKVENFGTAANEVVVDRDSTNTAAVTATGIVKALGPTSAYTAPSTEKAILIGGTFANNTAQQINLTVGVWDNSAGKEVQLASKIPVPTGSSFVISDAGKSVLEANDAIRVYSDSANAVDVTLAVLTGVS